MKGLFGVVLAILFLSSPSSLWAEYIIYLKGGHYIIADDCTFSSRKGTEKGSEAEKEFVFVEDCTVGEPEGLIFWSTIDGKFGEIDANNVFAIYGGKGLSDLKSPRERMPLEDYLITNRGEGFVNARTYKEQDAAVYGVKRDEIAKLGRRGVTEIAPEGEARGARGEGLCPGEPPEFTVSDLDLRRENLIGNVTNLSSTPWRPLFEVEVHLKPQAQLKERAKRSFVGKFKIEELDELRPGESVDFDARVRTQLDELVDTKLLEYVKRAVDPEGDARLCARKVKQPPGQPIAVSPPPRQALPGPVPSPSPPGKR